MNDFENNNLDNNGFYSKSANDIIQDNVTPPPSYTPPVFTQTDYVQSLEKNKKQKKEKVAKKTHSTGVVVLCCILAAIIGAGGAIGALWGYSFFNSDDEINTPIVTETKNDSSANGGGSSININVDEDAASIAEAVAKKCSQSVVGIRTTASVSDFFGGAKEQSGEGSGVIYTVDGYIITNYHVISEAVELSGSKIEVFLEDSSTKPYEAEVIGYNISCDLAVIKINAQNLTPAKLADSDELKVGQYVITIGAPGGLEFMGSVTYGIISGLDRIVSTDSQLGLIQTDAAINPGNSGGALLNTQGELIGINSSKIVSEEFEGMGFAIPSNSVKEKCDKIIARKGEDGAYLGVSVSETYTGEVLLFYGYPRGAVVSSVTPDSPAYKAGIERGDIITEFNGTIISEYTILSDALYDCEPGQTVTATIYREGKTYTATITLASVGS